MSILPSFAWNSKKSTAGSDQDAIWEYGVDFETGQLTGAKVNGAEAVKVWIWKCLMTERFLFPVYSWRYGSELRRYVGKYKTDEYLKTDLWLAIEDALLINKKISAITDFRATLVKDRLSISFTAKTAYGAVQVLDFNTTLSVKKQSNELDNALNALKAGRIGFAASENGELLYEDSADVRGLLAFALQGDELVATMSDELAKKVTLRIRDGALEAEYV